MANKHILRIHETESDLLSELKDKQIAWATDINEAIWRNGNNFYYIEASKYWNGSEFIEINSDQIYNVYNWDDYLTALSDVGNIKYIYMRENIQAPSVLTQNIDVYGQCEIIVYTGSQIFSFDPSGASNCELRYRGASGSPNFTSLNFLGNSITYVGFETLFVEDVYCRNEDIISSLPIDVQITNGAELGTPKFQYESQDGNFTCSVGTSDFIRELWTVPIFEIQTIGSAEGYKPKGTDFLNNGSSVYSNMSQADISENFSGDVYTNAFLGLTFTTSQLSGLLRKRFIGGSVLWSFNNLDVWNPSTFSDNPISFIGRGIDFTGGVSIDEDKRCSLALAPSTSNATLKIGDITDTQNDIYVEVLNIDGDVTLDSASTHNIYYEKINLNGFTLTDSGNVAVQQFWNNTNDSSGGGSQDLDSVLTQGNTSTESIGLGTEGDPSAWNTTFLPLTNNRATFAGRSGLNEADIFTNVYFDGLFKSIETGSATRFVLSQLGSMEFFRGDVTGANQTVNFDKVFEVSEDNEMILREASSSTANTPGYQVKANTTNGTLAIDHKIQGGAGFYYRYGEGGQAGSSNLIFYKDAGNPELNFEMPLQFKNIPTGTQAGLLAYDAQGKIIQGSGGGSQDLESVLTQGNTTGDNAIQFEEFTSWVSADFKTPAKVFNYNNEALILGAQARVYGQNTTGMNRLFMFISNDLGSTLEVRHDENRDVFTFRPGGSNGADLEIGVEGTANILFIPSGIASNVRTIIKAGTLEVEDGVFKLGSTTNASPTAGDIDFDGTNVNIRSDVTVNGSITATIPTGTQVGLVGYDANGKLIQGTGGGGGVTPGAWTNVTLASNISVRSGYRPLRYRSDGIDGVQVEGTCKYNTGFNLAPGFTVVLFTFASGSRPNNDFNVKAQVGYNGSTTEIDAWAHIDASTGQVTLKNSAAVAISELYDISFNFRFSLT